MTEAKKISKPKRTLVEIRAEKHALVTAIQQKIDKIDKWCATAKIPKCVVNGSHQDVVEFKDLLEKNQKIPYPSESLKKSPAKKIQARLDVINKIFTQFEYYFGAE